MLKKDLRAGMRAKLEGSTPSWCRFVVMFSVASQCRAREPSGSAVLAGQPVPSRAGLQNSHHLSFSN